MDDERRDSVDGGTGAVVAALASQPPARRHLAPGCLVLDDVDCRPRVSGTEGPAWSSKPDRRRRPVAVDGLAFAEQGIVGVEIGIPDDGRQAARGAAGAGSAGGAGTSHARADPG